MTRMKINIQGEGRRSALSYVHLDRSTVSGLLHCFAFVYIPFYYFDQKSNTVLYDNDKESYICLKCIIILHNYNKEVKVLCTYLAISWPKIKQYTCKAKEIPSFSINFAK